MSKTGLTRIEATSFVSPKWVPQLSDAKRVMEQIDRNPLVRYSTLTPNLKGLQDAIDTKSQEIAIFGAASESFSKKNINMTIEQSLKQFDQVVAKAKSLNIPIRGYVSCVVGCPYEGWYKISQLNIILRFNLIGEIKPLAVSHVVEKMLAMGCYEISLGDTIGVGNPKSIRNLLIELGKLVGEDQVGKLLAIHCHDTYGMALVNIAESLEHGVRVIDSSCAGLGGCPYAKGASGNVATEDVIYMLNGMGIKTGVSLEKILDAGEYILSVLNRSSLSKVNLAYARKNKKPTTV